MADHTQGWKIIRKTSKRAKRFTVLFDGSESGARRKWNKLDMTEGWTVMFRPGGSTELASDDFKHHAVNRQALRYIAAALDYLTVEAMLKDFTKDGAGARDRARGQKS